MVFKVPLSTGDYWDLKPPTLQHKMICGCRLKTGRSSRRSWKRGVYCVFPVDKYKEFQQSFLYIHNFLFQSCALHAICVVAWHETLQIHWGHRWNRQLGYEVAEIWRQKKEDVLKVKDIEETAEFVSYNQPFHHEDLGDCWLTVRYVSRIKPAMFSSHWLQWKGMSRHQEEDVALV